MGGPGPGASLSDTLAHFGVKGMKWGVRRKRTSSAPASEDSKRATVLKTKARSSGTKSLSNKDLQDLITRLNLEQQYSRLQPSKKQAAAKFVTEVVLGVGKQQVTRLANEKIGELVKSK